MSTSSLSSSSSSLLPCGHSRCCKRHEQRTSSNRAWRFLLVIISVAVGTIPTTARTSTTAAARTTTRAVSFSSTPSTDDSNNERIVYLENCANFVKVDLSKDHPNKIVRIRLFEKIPESYDLSCRTIIYASVAEFYRAWVNRSLTPHLSNYKVMVTLEDINMPVECDKIHSVVADAQRNRALFCHSLTQRLYQYQFNLFYRRENAALHKDYAIDLSVAVAYLPPLSTLDGPGRTGHNKTTRKGCPSEKFFQCSEDGLCIPSRFRCDKVNHCSDQSDESDCHDRFRHPEPIDASKETTAAVSDMPPPRPVTVMQTTPKSVSDSTEQSMSETEESDEPEESDKQEETEESDEPEETEVENVDDDSNEVDSSDDMLDSNASDEYNVSDEVTGDLDIQPPTTLPSSNTSSTAAAAAATTNTPSSNRFTSHGAATSSEQPQLPEIPPKSDDIEVASSPSINATTNAATTEHVVSVSSISRSATSPELIAEAEPATTTPITTTTGTTMPTVVTVPTQGATSTIQGATSEEPHSNEPATQRQVKSTTIPAATIVSDSTTAGAAASAAAEANTTTTPTTTKTLLETLLVRADDAHGSQIEQLPTGSVDSHSSDSHETAMSPRPQQTPSPPPTPLPLSPLSTTILSSVVQTDAEADSATDPATGGPSRTAESYSYEEDYDSTVVMTTTTTTTTMASLSRLPQPVDDKESLEQDTVTAISAASSGERPATDRTSTQVARTDLHDAGPLNRHHVEGDQERKGGRDVDAAVANDHNNNTTTTPHSIGIIMTPNQEAEDELPRNGPISSRKVDPTRRHSTTPRPERPPFPFGPRSDRLDSATSSAFCLHDAPLWRSALIDVAFLLACCLALAPRP